jgi:hypothetical protein
MGSAWVRHVGMFFQKQKNKKSACEHAKSLPFHPCSAKSRRACTVCTPYANAYYLYMKRHEKIYVGGLGRIFLHILPTDK